MELLIPGLLLVALMVWASTKIKKHAADAFEAEFIETENYTLQKPEGFLHVIGDEKRELSAYSKDFLKGDNTGIRQATIEIDVFPGSDVGTIRDAVKSAAVNFEVMAETTGVSEVQTQESANEMTVSAFYRIVAGAGRVYRLRFAVLPEYVDAYLARIEATLDSFRIKGN